jgi:hypothetical protein
MNRAEFSKAEYELLKDEIKHSKEKMFKLAVGSIVGIPTAYSVAEKTNVGPLIYSLPFLICTVTLVYLSESLAVMRAGRYIRQYIEPEVVDDDNRAVKGWEHWLEERPFPSNEPHRRLVDRLLALFFYIMFIFYYVVSSILAVQRAIPIYSPVTVAIGVAVYVSIGIFFIGFLIYMFNRSTCAV